MLRRVVHDVRRLSLGDETRYEAGHLVVSPGHLRQFFSDPALSDIRISITSPGDSVRLVKVLDAVEPRAKAGGGLFPGWVGDPNGTGRGEIHVLRGAAVVSAGYLPRAQESLVDMSGPAATLSPLGATHNIVVEFEPSQGAAWEEVDAALRRGVLQLAVALAETALKSEPDRIEDLPAVPSPGHDTLPAVGLITNLQTQGAFKDVFVFGESFAHSMPRLINPAELEDGAVVSGQYGHPGLKNPTILFQNHPLVAALRARDGKDLRFAGMILSPEPVDQVRKEAVSAEAVRLAKDLAWDGFIVTKEGGGNADSDMALKMDAAEEMEVRTVGLFAEMSGRRGDGPPVVGPPAKATAMVSTGNYDERIRLPGTAKALGGDRLEVAGADATDPLEVPTAVIFCSLNPLGWGRLTASPDIQGEPPGGQGEEGRTGAAASSSAVESAARSGPVPVVHYVNQFFAGIGGEEEAGRPPARLEGPAPVSRKLQTLLGDAFNVTATVFCGDDYAASRPDAAAEILDIIRAAGPGMVVAGPAFSSGRYGIACARVASAAAAAGIPALCGMHPDNPGLTEIEAPGAPGNMAAVATGATAREMSSSLQNMAKAAVKLASGEELTRADGLIQKASRRNRLAPVSAAERAVDLVLRRIAGDGDATEIPTADFGAVTPASPIEDPGRALVALLSEGGMVPAGNPGRLESARASKWLRYPLESKRALEQGEFQSVHGGFSTVAANADPNRILPLDAARDLEREGRIGRIFDEYFVTVGNGTPVANANRFGIEWAAELRRAGVQAAILTST